MDEPKQKSHGLRLPWSKKHLRAIVTAWATMCPLAAATIAPLSVLLDIPALFETWYQMDGAPLPDPKASLVLSGVSLAAAVVATLFLLVRFSVYEEYWVLATHLSVICWIIKTVVGLTNLVVFGVLAHQDDPSASFDEGYYCELVSFIISFVVLIALLFHWAVQFLGIADVRSLKIRRQGKMFMTNTLVFVLIVALSSLIMGQIEGWTYLQAIYFSVCSFETVGFGDFYPTTTASRVLAFPLDLLGICQLTIIITNLMTFFTSISRERAQKTRLRFERERRRAEQEGGKGGKGKNPRTLEKEIEFLEEMNRKRDWGDQMKELGWSVATFLMFWLVGALIFSKLEGWTYGIGLYFCYVFFLAIGYGDVRVQTPAGRVVFVIYSLLAVPVMTSFAVQTVASIFENVSQSRLRAHIQALTDRRRKHKEKKDSKDSNSASGASGRMSTWSKKAEEGKLHIREEEERAQEVVSHSEYVQRFRKQLEERRSTANLNSPARRNTPQASPGTPSEVQSRAEDEMVDQDMQMARRASVDRGAVRDKTDAEAFVEGEHLVDGVLKPETREAGAIEPDHLAEREALRAGRKNLSRRVRKEDDPEEIEESAENEEEQEDCEEASEMARAEEDIDHGKKSAPPPAETPEPSSSDADPPKPSEQVEKEVQHGHSPSIRSEEAVQDEDAELTDEVLELAAELERHARRLLINSYPTGSRAQILLRADWHVQLNEMRAVLREKVEDGRNESNTLEEASRADKQKMIGRVEEEAEMVLQPLSERETMEEVSRYRECFARLLVAGSELRKLKGREKFIFERRTAMSHETVEEE